MNAFNNLGMALVRPSATGSIDVVLVGGGLFSYPDLHVQGEGLVYAVCVCV